MSKPIKIIFFVVAFLKELSNNISEKMLGPKKFESQKFGFNKILGTTNFGSKRIKKNLGPKTTKIVVGQKRIESKNFWVQNIFGQKNVGAEKVM